VRRPLIPHEQFVKAWRKSRCIDDMVSYTGLTKNHIYTRARWMRSRGVKLTHFEREVLDVGKLNRGVE